MSVVMSVVAPSSVQSQENRSRRLIQQPIDVSMLLTRSKIEMELDGELHVEDKNAKQTGGVRSVPLKAKATNDYFEAIAFHQGVQAAAARQYVTARLENWVSGKSVVQTLRPDCREIRILQHDGTWEHYCPNQPLDRREVELLRSPINTMMLEQILPKEPAKTSSNWVISDEDAARLFNLDAVHQSDLRSKITGVEQGVAKIELQGSLKATADSVPTEIQIRGTAHVQLCSQGAMVKWLGVSIKESREISRYRPGFSLTARIQLIRQEEPDREWIQHRELIDLAAKDDASRWFVRLESTQGNYSTVAGRNWVTYLDGSEDSVWRLIENNQPIAQCNISQLPKLDPGTQLTAEGLEADVRAALKDRLNEVIGTTEQLTASGLRLLRMEVSGSQDKIPLHWIYAHLSDDSGRRLALVFTLAAEHAERFAGSDLQILDSLEFTAPSTGSSAESVVGTKQSALGPSPQRH